MTISHNLEWALSSPDPHHNTAKLAALRDGKVHYIDLYRKILAGPSGQRKDHHVGGVRLMSQPAKYDVAIMRHNGADTAGYATFELWCGEWATFGHDTDGRLRMLGYASSLAVAVDVVIAGVHVAMGRHDSARTSGSFRRVDRVNTDRSVA